MKAQCYRALFEGAPEAIILADVATSCVDLANERAVQLFGRTPADLSTLSYLELFDEETRRRLTRQAQHEGPPPGTFSTRGEVIRPDGSRCPVDITLRAVGVGKRRFLQLIMCDRAACHQTANELLIRRLEEQNAELISAHARLVDHDRVRTEFLGMMSHELRTPVNILIGYAHMLLESVAAGESLPATERASILRRMVAAGHTLSELVEDTLSVLRLDAGAVNLDLRPVALDRLFHDLKGNDRLLRGPDAVEERWAVEPDVPEIMTDQRKLQQVITNLVGNARKFTKAGHIDVHAEVAGKDRIRITVTDTGCGISREHLPNIFDLYRQAPSGQAHDGCGIGLYIVRRYLDMLQGRVECESTVGQGTTFTIELPLNARLADKTSTPTASNGPASSRTAA